MAFATALRPQLAGDASYTEVLVLAFLRFFTVINMRMFHVSHVCMFMFFFIL